MRKLGSDARLGEHIISLCRCYLKQGGYNQENNDISRFMQTFSSSVSDYFYYLNKTRTCSSLQTGKQVQTEAEV